MLLSLFFLSLENRVPMVLRRIYQAPGLAAPGPAEGEIDAGAHQQNKHDRPQTTPFTALLMASICASIVIPRSHVSAEHTHPLCPSKGLKILHIIAGFPFGCKPEIAKMQKGTKNGKNRRKTYKICKGYPSSCTT